MENMGTMRPTHYAETLSIKDEGEVITVAGYIAKCRNKGGIIFADLRDSSGILQLVFDDTTDKTVFEKANTLKSEYVVIAQGNIRKRSAVTDKIKTGEIELYVTQMNVLSHAETTPFEIRDEIKVKDELRLKYRYLDLRRPESHSPLVLRHKISKACRDYYDNNHFIEIETPMLIKSTPEGARDYLVPSRVQPNKFFALPQSPQLYKQLLMLSGFDRYFQIVKCFRDEDLRADRQPEFTQIDIEMSFVQEQDVMAMNEGFIKHVFKKVLDLDVQTPFERMPYKQAMDRFGSDKPDTRFGLELCDITACVDKSEFVVFKSAIETGSVRAINVKGGADTLTRKEIDKLTELAKTYGAKGLAYTRYTAEAKTSSFEKFMTEQEISDIYTATNFEQGDVLLVCASDKNDTVYASLGAVRLAVGEKLGLIDKTKFNFLWVTEFPLFEHDEENNRFVAKHHPFTMPMDEDLDKIQTDPANCRAKAYDMVLNGCEIGGGSIRINNPEIQAEMFKALGFTEQRMQDSFGFLIEAYKYGAPPHGGMAFGLDRLVMLMLGKESIRDVIAFPKVQNAGELMTNCPESVEEKQLQELFISMIKPE